MCILNVAGRLDYSNLQWKEINQLGGCCSDQKKKKKIMAVWTKPVMVKINIQKIHVDMTRCQYCAMRCTCTNSWNSHKQHVGKVFFSTFYR